MGSMKSINDESLASRLKEVFEIVDEQKNGFISLDHFLELAKEFTSSNGHNNSAKVIETMASVLDSEKTGKISYDGFCKGVKEMLKSNNASIDDTNINQTAIDDFLTVRRFSADGSKSPEIYETTATPDPEEGEEGEEEEVMAPTRPTSTDVHHHLSAANQPSMQSSLENGADSGAWESAAFDVPWSTPASEENPTIQISLRSAHNNIYQNNSYQNNSYQNNSYQNNSLLDTDLENDDRSAIFFVRKSPSTPMSTPRSSVRSATTPRVSAPVSRTGSFRKSVTPSSIASSQLYRNSSSTNCSELMMNDEQVYDLTDKISKLEDKLACLSETQKKNEDKQLKMKEENVQLVERVHMLEELLRDMEASNEERFMEEQKKNKELLMKTERDKANQIELLQQSLKIVETEYNELKTEVPTLRSENEQLRRQNFNLEREMAKVRQEYSEVADEKINLQELLHNEQQKIQRERLANSQLLDQLTQELNELRLCKSDLLRLSPAMQKSSLDREELPMSLRTELETQIKQMKQDNMNLKYQLEELQALILNKHVEEGMNFLDNQKDTSFNTLAAELQDVPRNELMQALHKEQEANRKLKEYIEFITLRILDSNPGLLEIGKKNK